MVDPWRNLPVTTMGIGQWFNHDFPPVIVDIGLSMHAHFDHDGLHRLYANMLMDRIVGEFSLGDVRIHDIAEKHVSDFSHCIYNFTEATMERGVDPRPPDNPRSWDNTLFVRDGRAADPPLGRQPSRPARESGRQSGIALILHWGDNHESRPARPDESGGQSAADGCATMREVLSKSKIDDDRQHILSYDRSHVTQPVRRCSAGENCRSLPRNPSSKVCIPGHYR